MYTDEELDLFVRWSRHSGTYVDEVTGQVLYDISLHIPFDQVLANAHKEVQSAARTVFRSLIERAGGLLDRPITLWRGEGGAGAYSGRDYPVRADQIEEYIRFRRFAEVTNWKTGDTVRPFPGPASFTSEESIAHSEMFGASDSRIVFVVESARTGMRLPYAEMREAGLLHGPADRPEFIQRPNILYEVMQISRDVSAGPFGSSAQTCPVAVRVTLREV